MKQLITAIVALGFAGIAAGAGAQTGDPERTRQQEALAHAVVIQTAWRSVRERIRVADAANLWEDEWSGLVDPPSGSWWLASWTERGLTARYCDGVLAVYATSDELKGVQRDHREVQVAPARYGNGRTGLHIILANSRIAVGAHGRDDEALPLCMAVPSTTGDRVGLVSAVADPIRTVTGFRWHTERREVPCVSSPSDLIREARRMPIQLTSVRGAGETRGRDLSVTDPGNPAIWPSDCGLRAGLGPKAQCTAWKRVGGQCPHVFAQAAAPTPIPDPVINCSSASVHKTTASCSCSSGETGTCTLHYEQDTWNRDFQVRPGAPVVTTRRFACVDSAGAAFGPSTKQLVRRVDDCTPIQTGCQSGCGPDGDDNGGHSGTSGTGTGTSGNAGEVGGIGGYHGPTDSHSGVSPGDSGHGDSGSGDGDSGAGDSGGGGGNGGGPP